MRDHEWTGRRGGLDRKAWIGPGSLQVFPILLVLILVPGGCGKVGAPLPPVVEIPQAISDLTVSQIGSDLRFDWTNPSENIDLSPLTRPGDVVILSDGDVILRVPVSGAGEAQSVLWPVRDQVGETHIWSIVVGSGDQRFSESSNAIEIRVVDVPGPVVDFHATVDQDRITLEWSEPLEGGDLVGEVGVFRSGVQIANLSGNVRLFEDEQFVEGDTYVYRITVFRLTEAGRVPGTDSASLEVIAVDQVPPAAPGGLTRRPFNDGVLLTWDISPESDVIGYQVFRRTGPDSPFLPLNDGVQVVTGYEDPGYVPGMAYTVLAVDRSGNQSPQAAVLD